MGAKKKTEILGLAEKIEGQSLIIRNCLSPFRTFGSPHDRVFQTFYPPIIAVYTECKVSQGKIIIIIIIITFILRG